MHIFPSVLLVSLVVAPAAVGAQQTAAAAVPAPAAPAARTASSLLKPALSQAQVTLSTLKVDKWKRGSVRDEAGENVSSLLHDLQANVPPLLAAADAEPGALSRALPVIKHLDAFYDVFLRVEEAARVAAPSEQITALQATMLAINQARIAYDDELQAQAAGHEKLLFDLRTQLQTQSEAAERSARDLKAAEAKAAACKPAAPKKRVVRRHAPAKKPSAGTAKPQ